MIRTAVYFADNPELHRPYRLHVRNPPLSHSAGQLYESRPVGLNGLCSPFNRSPYQSALIVTPFQKATRPAICRAASFGVG